MKLYENVFIVRPSLSPAQVESIAENFANVVAKDGGKVGKSEYCGLRHLAYPIKKNTKGHYVLMNITASGTTVAELERLMRLNEDVMRFLTIAVEEHDDNPSALTQQQRTGRDNYNSTRPERGERRNNRDEEDSTPDQE